MRMTVSNMVQVSTDRVNNSGRVLAIMAHLSPTFIPERMGERHQVQSAGPNQALQMSRSGSLAAAESRHLMFGRRLDPQNVERGLMFGRAR